MMDGHQRREYEYEQHQRHAYQVAMQHHAARMGHVFGGATAPSATLGGGAPPQHPSPGGAPAVVPPPPPPPPSAAAAAAAHSTTYLSHHHMSGGTPSQTHQQQPQLVGPAITERAYSSRVHPYLDNKPKAPPPAPLQTPTQIPSPPASASYSPPLLPHTPRPTSSDRPPQISMFIAKLWDLVHSPHMAPLLRFICSGRVLLIYPGEQFARQALFPSYKHSNFASFVRQLNLYGFRRINSLELMEDTNDPIDLDRVTAEEPPQAFSHPYFNASATPTELALVRPKTTRVRKPRRSSSHVSSP